MLFPSPSVESFDSFGFSSGLRAAIQQKGWQRPTEIQHQALPIAMAGDDLIGKAPTGSGKTGAFALPLLERVASISEKGVYGLVISPVRELAIQTADELRSFTKAHSGDPKSVFPDVDVHCVIGGTSTKLTKADIFQSKLPSIVTGTPGRLLDMIHSGYLNTRDLQIVVIDEFDTALSKGMQRDILEILKYTRYGKQTMLFSATFPDEVRKKAYYLLHENAKLVEQQAAKIPPQIEHFAYQVAGQPEKSDLLMSLICSNLIDRAVIFVRSRGDTKSVSEDMRQMGCSVTYISSDIKCQSVRERNLNLFKTGKVQFLVATDIVGRGIDFPDSPWIINYDLPLHNQDYVHRAGRTGRQGRPGQVISFVSERHAMVLDALAKEHEFKVGYLRELDLLSL